MRTSFQTLKAELIKNSVLYAPDFTKDFIVQTDASAVGARVVLSQVINGQEHPIVFLSKKFTKAERNYSTKEGEFAAIVYAVRKLNYYLDGRTFILQKDHNPLIYLKKNDRYEFEINKMGFMSSTVQF